jgi:SAM-dependent methyltransferase
MSDMSPEMEALKTRLKATWSAGDYGRVARDLESSAAEFLARIPIEAGTRVLDVACGTGQLAFAAAAAGARATGLDIAPNLIEQARARATAEGADIRFDEGDAEMLPYEAASCDLVVSLIGAMFAPRPDQVAAELLRVCRPGGRIVMGNWTPEGFIGQMFKTVAQHVPPPAGMPSPLKWGEEATVRLRLRQGIAELRMARRMYPFHYPFGPSEVVEFYRTHFGPIHRAFAGLEPTHQEALRRDLEELWASHHRGDEGTTHVDAELLEVVATRK